MKTTQFTITATVVLTLFTTSGCVTYTSVKDEPRKKVRFTSAHTAQAFYDAYLAASSPKVKRSIAIGFKLPVPYWHMKLSTENVRFNAAIQTTDTNHDGIVSGKEASAYQRGLKPADAKTRPFQPGA